MYGRPKRASSSDSPAGSVHRQPDAHGPPMIQGPSSHSTNEEQSIRRAVDQSEGSGESDGGGESGGQAAGL